MNLSQIKSVKYNYPSGYQADTDSECDILQGKYKTLAHVEQSASRGTAKAMIRMGLAYYYGELTPKDDQKAEEYFENAIVTLRKKIADKQQELVSDESKKKIQNLKRRLAYALVWKGDLVYHKEADNWRYWLSNALEAIPMIREASVLHHSQVDFFKEYCDYYSLKQILNRVFFERQQHWKHSRLIRLWVCLIIHIDIHWKQPFPSRTRP